ncbi:MAG: thioredoxin domain-containing protein [Deltaproteobacteria bacterium]|nr:thioredoxin domain-containing protein [Deltaproteobacteria bacterium]
MNIFTTRRPSSIPALLCILLLACSPDPSGTGEVAENRGEPIARLGDQIIYRDEVAPAVAYQVYRREVDIYSLLKGETEALISNRVLAMEAERRKIALEDLLRVEIDEKVEPAGEADVDAYLAGHPQEAGSGKETRARIRYFLSETRREERRLALQEDLRARAGFEFLLEPPLAIRTRLDVADAPVRGPAEAPITLVHFATFSSPLSVRSAGYLRRLVEEFPGKIRWVHRHFLNPHDETGLLAAEFAVAAQDQEVFWEAHDALFDLEGNLDERKMLGVAHKIGVDDDTMRQVGIDEKYLKAVKRDIDAGVKAGVRSEPVVYVNGRYFSSTFPYERLRQMVAEELGEAPPSVEPDDPLAGPLPAPSRGGG